MTNTKSNEEVEAPEVTLEPQLDLSPAPRKSGLPAERRPYKFTAENKRKILVALQMGHDAKTAAAYGGVTERTLVNWLREGIMAGPESEGLAKEYYDFAELCTQARANSQIGLVAIAWRHARDDGKVAIALMEKLFPEKYGRQTTVKGKVEHTHDHTHKKVDYSALSDEELEHAEMMARKVQHQKDKEEAIDAEILE